jgi:hypothetical protein
MKSGWKNVVLPSQARIILAVSAAMATRKTTRRPPLDRHTIPHALLQDHQPHGAARSADLESQLLPIIVRPDPKAF